MEISSSYLKENQDAQSRKQKVRIREKGHGRRHEGSQEKGYAHEDNEEGLKEIAHEL